MSQAGPTEREIARNLKKIERWRELGFEVEGLEKLLRKDFGKFKEKKLDILARQIDRESGTEKGIKAERGAGKKTKEEKRATTGGKGRGPGPGTEGDLAKGEGKVFKSRKGVVTGERDKRDKELNRDKQNRGGRKGKGPSEGRGVNRDKQDRGGRKGGLGAERGEMDGASDILLIGGDRRGKKVPKVAVISLENGRKGIKKSRIGEDDTPARRSDTSKRALRKGEGGGVGSGEEEASPGVKDRVGDEGSRSANGIGTERVSEPVPAPSEDVILVGRPQKGGKKARTESEGVIILDNKEVVEEDDRYHYYDVSPGEEERRGGASKEKGKRRYREKDKRVRDTIISAGIFVILILAGVLVLSPGAVKDLLDREDNAKESVPSITISRPQNDTTFISGELITFRARIEQGEDDIDSYEWDFGDGNSASSKETTHFYAAEFKRDFKATFYVEMLSGVKYDSSITLHIEPLLVELPEKRAGQGAEYDIDSDLLFSDPEGIDVLSGDNADIRLTELELRGDGTQEVLLRRSEESVEDGFLLDHDTYERNVRQSQYLKGNATMTYSNNAGRLDRVIKLSGNMDLENRQFNDLSTERPVKNTLNLTTTLYSELEEDKGFKEKDRLISYPDYSQPFLIFDITRIRQNRTFKLGESEPGGVGALPYMWNIKDVDNVEGRPALLVDVKLDKNTLASYGVTHHKIELWITNGMAFPVKFRLELRAKDGGSDLYIALEGIMRTETYSRGDQSISGLECGKGFNESAHHISRSDDKDASLGDEFDEIRRIPRTGNGSTVIQRFSIEEAYDSIRGQPDLGDYLSRHPGAFAVESACNITGEGVTWNLTFGEEEEGEGLSYLVHESGNFTSEIVNVSGVSSTPVELGEVLSYGGALHTFRGHPLIRERFYTGSGGAIDLEKGKIGANVNIPTLSLEVLYTGNVNSLDLGYYLRRSDRTGEGAEEIAVLNGSTGQILYYLEHTEETPRFDVSDFVGQ